MAAAARPATPAAAIRECNPMHYPNIRVMLQLACTVSDPAGGTPLSSMCNKLGSVLTDIY